MNGKWPTLSPREYNKLERSGIGSCDQLIETIKIFGLLSMDEGFCFAGKGAPYIRMAGEIMWKRYMAMLDSVGFDWKSYVGLRHTWEGPKTEQEFHIRINKKIDELIELLKQYQVSRPSNNVLQPTLTTRPGGEA